jgi:uncharacterized delta-60 repeat protein
MKNKIWFTQLLIAALVLLNSNLSFSQFAGSLDNSFTRDGKVTTRIGNVLTIGNAVAIQKDGKIVVAGYTDDFSNADFALVRYNPDGTLDGSFGGDGKVTTDFGGNDYGYSVVIQSNGKILVAGYSGDISDYDFAVSRYNWDGSPDNNFGVDGKIITDFGSSGLWSVNRYQQLDKKNCSSRIFQ